MSTIKDNVIRHWIIGFCVGVTLVGVILTLPNSKLEIASKALTECEKTLPRNQKCMIIAVPRPFEEQK